jgi:surfactin synthase thioesterase subunit
LTTPKKIDIIHNVAIKLFCFPYAGAGASIYRAWIRMVDDRLTIVPVQLPGREELFAQAPNRNINEAIDHVVELVRSNAQEGERIAMFGHSFGAVLGFAVAQHLIDAPYLRLVRLVVSGAICPITPLGRKSDDLSDDDFVANVEEIAGYSHPALADSELRDIVLPALRADVLLHESYVIQDPVILDTPITVIRGADDHLVSREACAAWQRVTSKDVDILELTGSHMYFAESPVQLLSLLTQILESSSL